MTGPFVFAELDAVSMDSPDAGTIQVYRQTSDKAATLSATAPLTAFGNTDPLTAPLTPVIVVGQSLPDGSNPFEGVADPTTVADFTTTAPPVSPGGQVDLSVPVLGSLPVRNWIGIAFKL